MTVDVMATVDGCTFATTDATSIGPVDSRSTGVAGSALDAVDTGAAVTSSLAASPAR
jgi:hypothetical protein